MSLNQVATVAPPEGNAVDSQGTSRRRRARRRREALSGLALVAPAGLLITVIFLAPLALSVWMSLMDWPLLGERSFVGFDNYVRLVGDPQVRDSLVFTLLFAVAIIPVTLLIGLSLALIVERRRPGVGIVRTAVFAPVAIGFAAAAYLFLAFTNTATGLLNRALVDVGISERPINWLLNPTLAMVLVVIVTVWKTAGFAMIALMNGLQSIGEDVLDAARVDGAGRLRMLLQIKLPLMKDSIAFALTFTAIAAFLAFDQFYILTGGAPSNSTVTVVYRIYNTAFIQGQLGYAAAFSLVFLVIVLSLTATQLALIRRGRDR